MSSRLYSLCEQIEKVINEKNLDPFKIKGQISLNCGFIVGLIGPNSPDDPVKEERLKKAIHEVLKISL